MKNYEVLEKLAIAHNFLAQVLPQLKEDLHGDMLVRVAKDMESIEQTRAELGRRYFGATFVP